MQLPDPIEHFDTVTSNGRGVALTANGQPPRPIAFGDQAKLAPPTVQITTILTGITWYAPACILPYFEMCRDLSFHVDLEHTALPSGGLLLQDFHSLPTNFSTN